MHHARKVGTGDISERIIHSRKDEIGELLTTICQMRLKLNEIVAEILASSSPVTGSAGAALHLGLSISFCTLQVVPEAGTGSVEPKPLRRLGGRI